MNYLLHGFGVFLGVVAGTAVTILVHLYLQRRSETQQIRNLKFELELNIRKIGTWLEELRRYRDAVNGDSLHNYFGWFDLGKVISVTANAMFQSGLLYKAISHDHIGALQVIFSECSPAGEQYINNQLGQTRQVFERCRTENRLDAWIATFKPEAIGHAEFWERKFRAHQRTLQEIVGSIR